MATVHAFTFSRVENVYTICKPSNESSRKPRKGVGLVGAKSPNVLSSFPVVESVYRLTSFRCNIGERFKQGRVSELEDTMPCRQADRKKNFSKNRTAANFLVRCGQNFGDLVYQISTSLRSKHWAETREITKLRSMKKDMKACVVAEVLRLETNAEKALDFFRWAEKLEEYEHHPISYYTIIDKLSSSNMLNVVKGIIDQMNNNRIQINPRIFCLLIKWYGKYGKAKEAHDIFVLMKKEGYMLRTQCYNTILVALVRGKEFEMAINIHVEMLAYKIAMDSRETFEAMIECFSLENKVGEAKGMLEDMLDKGYSPNVVAYTQLISAFVKRRNMSQAFDIFGKMQEQGCSPNVITYSAIMHGLCLEGKVEEALAWLQKIPSKGCIPDIYSYTILMDGLAKASRTNEAKQLLSEAIVKGLVPTIFGYNALFDGYFREGRSDDALDLFYEMSGKGVRPNRKSYNILISGLAKWRRIPEALRFKDAMEVKGYKPDIPTLMILLNGLCKEGRPKYASRLFQKLQEMGFHDPEAYFMVINVNLLAGEAKEALTLFYMLVRNNLPNLLVYNKVLKEFCNSGRLDDAIGLLKFIIENIKVLFQKSKGSPLCKRDLPARVTSYSILRKELCKEGRGYVARQFYEAALKRSFSLLQS